MEQLFVNRFRFIFSLSFLIVTQSANALTSSTVLGSNFVNGQSTYSTTFADGTSATFVGSSAFQKTTDFGITGVGILGGLTAGEIDIGESLTGTFSRQVIVSTLNVGMLFDGPEFGDVNEKAQFFVNFSDGGTGTYFLAATDKLTASWTGMGSVSPVTGTSSNNGTTGSWQLSNPFGARSINSIIFTAVTGTAKPSCSNCTNQSDYTFVSMAVTPVPEAHTSAMLLTGLFMIGALVLRRTRS